MKLPKIQILSASITSTLGLFLLLAYLIIIQNPALAVDFISSLTFLAISLSLFIASYLIFKSANLHMGVEHTQTHHKVSPIILALLLIGLSLFFIFEGVLLGVEGGGIFFSLRFSTALTIVLINLTAAVNLAVSSNQSTKTAILLLKTAIVMLFLFMVHFVFTVEQHSITSFILIFFILNLAPQATITYFADFFGKRLSL